MAGYVLEKVTVKALSQAIEEELASLVDAGDVDDAEFSLYRLESLPEGARLVSIHDLDSMRKRGYTVQEGYWMVNGCAWYVVVLG